MANNTKDVEVRGDMLLMRGLWLDGTETPYYAVPRPSYPVSYLTHKFRRHLNRMLDDPAIIEIRIRRAVIGDEVILRGDNDDTNVFRVTRQVGKTTHLTFARHGEPRKSQE
jgi:hypothetical protein